MNELLNNVNNTLIQWKNWVEIKVKQKICNVFAYWHRSNTSAADHPVFGAGIQALSKWAESGATSSGQPQKPHPKTIGTASSCAHEVGSGCSWERVMFTFFLKGFLDLKVDKANIFYLFFFWQIDYSCIKHVIKWTSLRKQSPTRGETCRPRPVHSASYHSYGCCHIQPLVS